MWELIQQNKRKSWVLFIMMGACLALLGYLVGAAYAPPDGGVAGLAIALFIWMLLSIISYFSGDSIMLSISGARQITSDVHPQLFNVVEEMKIASSMPAMPKVYIIDEAAPNAFATGRKPQSSAVAVTAGLLSRMNRDELQGVVAHEMSHIQNRDVMFMTFAGIMLGSIALISQVFLRGAFFSGGMSGRVRTRGSDRGGGQGQAIIMIVALVFAILAPIMARLLYFAISRKREYLADASAARLTRYPEGLASALEKLSKSTEDLPRANNITAPLYIVNPLKKAGAKLSNLSSTHPPVEERIRVLRTMAGGAGFLQYQEAFNRVTGSKSKLIPQSGLKDSAQAAIRTGSVDAGAPVTQTKRTVDDLVRAVNGFVFLTCTCGLKAKIPPDFKKESFPCPRCGSVLRVPTAELATAAAMASGLARDANGVPQEHPQLQRMTYHRKGSGWESLSCACGKTIQLSPQFSGSKLVCNGCGREITIER
jgi:heat shock protein HtpX